MSKDKGVKNVKKAPADKSLGKSKPPSAYKSESKSGNTTIKVAPKTENKGGAKP
jgi:hypothetical protein